MHAKCHNLVLKAPQVVQSDAEVTDESLLEAGEVLDSMMSLTRESGAGKKVATSILGWTSV